jgi:hypothetical protein
MFVQVHTWGSGKTAEGRLDGARGSQYLSRWADRLEAGSKPSGVTVGECGSLAFETDCRGFASLDGSLV